MSWRSRGGLYFRVYLAQRRVVTFVQSMESETESTNWVSAGVVNDVGAEDHEPGHVPEILGLVAGHVLMDRWSTGWIFVPDGQGWYTREEAARRGLCIRRSIMKPWR